VIAGYGPTLKKLLLRWLFLFPSHRDELTIARSFNCGWRGANPIRLAPASERVQFETSKSTDKGELQSFRWDESRLGASNPQLKLRAIVECASGAPARVVWATPERSHFLFIFTNGLAHDARTARRITSTVLAMP